MDEALQQGKGCSGNCRSPGTDREAQRRICHPERFTRVAPVTPRPANPEEDRKGPREQEERGEGE